MGLHLLFEIWLILCARAGLTKRGDGVSVPQFLTVVLHGKFFVSAGPLCLSASCILGMPHIAGPHLVAMSSRTEERILNARVPFPALLRPLFQLRLTTGENV